MESEKGRAWDGCGDPNGDTTCRGVVRLHDNDGAPMMVVTLCKVQQAMIVLVLVLAREEKGKNAQEEKRKGKEKKKKGGRIDMSRPNFLMPTCQFLKREKLHFKCII